MYYVYILYSPKTSRYYIGSCDDMDKRLYHHNRGLTPSTKAGAPEWEVRYLEYHEDRTAALKREREIKKKKSRKYIEWLINSNFQGDQQSAPAPVGKVIGSNLSSVGLPGIRPVSGPSGNVGE